MTNLDLAVANGTLQKPKIWDPLLEFLWERGFIHERDYIEHLTRAGYTLVKIEGVGIECRAPRQVQLANAFCRYSALATAI